VGSLEAYFEIGGGTAFIRLLAIQKRSKKEGKEKGTTATA